MHDCVESNKIAFQRLYVRTCISSYYILFFASPKMGIFWVREVHEWEEVKLNA